MARPAGRYFASVIAKIRDAKKKEQIVIDDGFKMRLRQQLMAKIAVQAQPAKTSWMERLAPFKTYFAVVPALALVIVAVVGISKLPIVFKSNTVVPVANPSQENNQVQPNDQNATNVEQSSMVANNETGIKTFPGRYVLPSNYFNNTAADASPSFDPQFLQTNVEAPQPLSTVQPEQTAATTSTANSTAPEQKTAPSEQTSMPVQQVPVQYFSYQSEQKSAQISEGNIQPAPQPVQQESAQAPTLPSVSGSTPLQATAPAADSVSGSTPSVEAQVNQTALSNTTTASSSPSIVPAAVENVQPLAEVKVPAATEIKPTAKMVTTAPAVGELHLNEIAALPAERLETNVYYSGNFSNDEKTVLEKNVVPYLAGTKTVESVNVYQKDAATIAIELTFASGKIAIYHYKVDENGTWRLIQYTVGTVRK